MSLLTNSAKKQDTGIVLLIILLVISLMLTVAPIPNVIKWVWPQWLLLLVVYKNITKPEHYGIIFGFCCGVLLDLLLGNKLGVHGLSFSIISYFINKIHQRIYLFAGIQLFGLVFMFALMDFISVIIFTPAKTNWIFIGHSVLSSLSTAIIWSFITATIGIKRKF